MLPERYNDEGGIIMWLSPQTLLNSVYILKKYVRLSLIRSLSLRRFTKGTVDLNYYH